MIKRSLLCVLSVLLSILFLLFCLVGCKSKKDVYGAASDFIEVSHPETPNKNAFSDDEADDTTDKSANSGNTTSSKSGTSSDTISSNTDDPFVTDPLGKDTNSSSASSGNSGNSSGDTDSEDKPLGMDMGPIVLFD